MFHARKLKPDRSILGWVIPLSILPVFGLSAVIFGVVGGLIVLVCYFGAFGVYALYIFFRTGNREHLIVTAYTLFIAAMFFNALLSRPDLDLREARLEWKIAYISGTIFFGVLLIYLAATKKIKWRGREIFELAAEGVDETGNGYTPRPRPVGRVEFSKQEILAFARFCARHLISIVYVSPRQVTFVPVKMSDEYARLLKLGGSYQEASWISFDFDGDVSVHITQKDYLDYLEPLAFDKLCESLGQLFIEFAEMHRRGEGVRIIDRLDTVGLNYFS